MDIFFCKNINNSVIQLDETESIHCIRSLRHRTGDHVAVVNGAGDYYETEIVETGKKNATLSIIRHISAYKQRPYKLHIAIAPMKQIDRFEWFLEKSTEMGIDTIIPLICKRSERTHIRLDRLQQLLVTTMKQSQQAYLPELTEPVAYKHFLNHSLKEQYTGCECFFGYCDEDIQNTLNSRYTKGNDVLILIGPAGDFDETEIAMAFEKGVIPFSMGNNRLRTETAGMMACSWIHVLNSPG